MLKHFLPTLSLLLLATNVIFGQITFDQKKATQILDQLTQDGLVIGGIAGVAVNGEILWTDYTGYSNEAEKIAFKDITLNRTASIAKPMTAVAALQLMEADKIDLDVPIQQYVEDLPTAIGSTITTRHLLNHVSGIDGYASGKEAQTQKNYLTLKEAAKTFQDRPLISKPGIKFTYSSYGYVILGLVIEGASGMNYGQYMKENVFAKAGMQNTAIEIFGKQYPNKSSLYHRSGNGKIKLSKKPNNLSNRVPGGGFHTTASDMLKFGNALLDGTLISAESFEAMMYNPGIRPKEEGNGYGFGWYLYGDNPTYGTVIGHTGEQTGTSSQIILLPEINATVIVLTNTSGSLGDVFNSAVKLFHCINLGE